MSATVLLATRRQIFLLAVLCLLLCPLAVASAADAPQATVRSRQLSLPSLFGDGMVLPQGKAVVWGSGDPWAVVTVVVGSSTATAKASGDGWWRAELKGLKAPGPYTMIVTDGSTTLTFKRVAVGQVWLCAGSALLDASGPVDKPAVADEAARGDVRVFQVPPVSAYQPAETVSGAWQSAQATSSLHISAVATQFGAELSQRLGIPVGIIQATMTNAPAESFVPIESIVANDDLSPLIRWYDRNKPAKSAPDETINAFLPRLPAGAWNGMIAPLIPYAITGVVWDTSDSNSARAAQYGILLPTMIRSWRKAWGIGDFPFLYLQSAASGGTSDSPSDSIVAEMRDSQNLALALPNTAMEATLDLYFDTKNRLNDNQILAQRLAKAAIAKTTADKSEYMGPSVKSVKVENGALRVRFDHVDGGLTLSGGELLRTFQIAGPDRTWQWADARIEGTDVIVSLHEVPNPVAVRYAWADNWIQMPPPANLANKAGFPAGTFRTDAWPLVTDGIVAGGGAFPVEKKAFSTR